MYPETQGTAIPGTELCLRSWSGGNPEPGLFQFDHGRGLLRHQGGLHARMVPGKRKALAVTGMLKVGTAARHRVCLDNHKGFSAGEGGAGEGQVRLLVPTFDPTRHCS